MIHPVERPTTLMKAQQMSSVVQRILHIQRHAPVALIVEPDLHAHTSELLVNAIRGGRMVRVRWSELTDDEKRGAYRNCFQPNTYD